MIAVDSPHPDALSLRQAFGCFPSGVAAVCAVVDDAPVGMAVSSFTSVSLDPPLLSVCIQHTSTTWPRLRDVARLGLSVLSEDQEHACRALASKTGDRFAGVTRHVTADGAALIEGAVAWFETTLRAEVPAGDHLIALLEISRLWMEPDGNPLVFHRSRYRRLATPERQAS